MRTKLLMEPHCGKHREFQREAGRGQLGGSKQMVVYNSHALVLFELVFTHHVTYATEGVAKH